MTAADVVDIIRCADPSYKLAEQVHVYLSRTLARQRPGKVELRAVPAGLADLMRRYRNRECVTVKQAARRAGVSFNSWYRYERGRAHVGKSGLYRILVLLEAA